VFGKVTWIPSFPLFLLSKLGQLKCLGHFLGRFGGVLEGLWGQLRACGRHLGQSASTLEHQLYFIDDTCHTTAFWRP